MIKVVIFDWNGTLINDLDIHREAYMQVFEGKGAKREDIKEILDNVLGNESASVLGKKIYEKTGIVYETIVAEKTKIYNNKVSKMGDSVFFKDTKEVLNNLKDRYVLYVVTGSWKEQIVGVVPQEYLDYFKGIYSTVSDDIKDKPEPTSLLNVAKENNIDVKECVYVGDAPQDLYAAKNAKMPFIGVATGKISKEDLKAMGTEIVVDRLKDIINIIDKL